ncbi:head scaffolding protein [Anabaena phage A-4L]|uniref:Scaffold protein n=1 Tax=Anabaena phage A-4L TaxID=1357732 RepID=A0A059PY43_9CAUD|nr:head scaffolding protein [Anabaena phage A-4L]AGR48561.1 scaffold protein [Anabaena phage A-4L]
MLTNNQQPNPNIHSPLTPSPAQQYANGGFTSNPAPVPGDVGGGLPPSQPNSQPQAAPASQPDPEFDRFANQFKQYAGVDFREAVSEIQQLREYRQTQEIKRQEQQIARVWGVDESQLEYRLGLVKETWNNLPEDQRREILYRTGYDEIGAASIIWQQIEQQQEQGGGGGLFSEPQQVPQQPNGVPTLDRNSAQASRQASNKYAFSQSQINTMGADEYRANADAIAKAYASGRVLRDLF